MSDCESSWSLQPQNVHQNGTRDSAPLRDPPALTSKPSTDEMDCIICCEALVHLSNGCQVEDELIDDTLQICSLCKKSTHTYCLSLWFDKGYFAEQCPHCRVEVTASFAFEVIKVGKGDETAQAWRNYKDEDATMQQYWRDYRRMPPQYHHGPDSEPYDESEPEEQEGESDLEEQEESEPESEEQEESEPESEEHEESKPDKRPTTDSDLDMEDPEDDSEYEDDSDNEDDEE